MKRRWEADELVEHFTLDETERDLLANKTGTTRLGFAVLLKYFQMEARFPTDSRWRSIHGWRSRRRRRTITR